MSDVRLPKVVALTLCERVEVIPGRRGFSLIGVFQNLRLEAVPSAPQQFTVYASLYDGVGEGTIKLSFIHLESEQEVHRYRRWVKFPGRQQYAHQEWRITNCVFPAFGRYSVSLHFEGLEITNRQLDIFKE